jgi:hypothetical protein
MNMWNDRLRLDPAEEWYPRSKPSCTCVNRGPSMEHFEDCPQSGQDWRPYVTPDSTMFYQPQSIPGHEAETTHTPIVGVWKHIASSGGGVWLQLNPGDIPPTVRIRARDEAQLGLATTEQLLRELECRGRASHSKAGELLMRDCDRILRELPPSMRSYRSIG